LCLASIVVRGTLRAHPLRTFGFASNNSNYCPFQGKIMNRSILIAVALSALLVGCGQETPPPAAPAPVAPAAEPAPAPAPAAEPAPTAAPVEPAAPAADAPAAAPGAGPAPVMDAPKEEMKK